MEIDRIYPPCFFPPPTPRDGALRFTRPLRTQAARDAAAANDEADSAAAAVALDGVRPAKDAAPTGAGASVYHGVSLLVHPAELEALPTAVAVLGAAGALESYTLSVAWKVRHVASPPTLHQG